MTRMMSSIVAPIIRVSRLDRHPNADTLLTTHAFDYPVTVKDGEVKEGDMAAYIPITSQLSADEPRTRHLFGRDGRIRARKIRGIFSMGALVRMPDDSVEGDNAADLLKITRHESPDDVDEHETAEPQDAKFLVPRYTDIENLRRWPDVLALGEDVIIREKFHGNLLRAASINGELVIASKRHIRDASDGSVWSISAKSASLAERLRGLSIAIYGEVIGTKSLKYSSMAPRLVVFDAFDLARGTYLDCDDFDRFISQTGLTGASELHRGAWSQDLTALAEGASTLGDHVREGFVVKPKTERHAKRLGRVILKLHGEGFLLRGDNR